MEYNEFANELKRVLRVLDEEVMLYKNFLVYFSTVIGCSQAKNSKEVLEYLTDYLQDLIDDSNTELEILNKIDNLVDDTVSNLTSFFLEDTDEYYLYVNILKKISNSSSKRLTDMYPEIIRFLNIFSYKVFVYRNYKTVKRQKYISEREYASYIQVLKK